MRLIDMHDFIGVASDQFATMPDDTAVTFGCRAAGGRRHHSTRRATVATSRKASFFMGALPALTLPAAKHYNLH